MEEALSLCVCGGRSSWDQHPEASNQQTRGRVCPLLWQGLGSLGLRSGSAAPEISLLPDSEVPRVQPAGRSSPRF